MVVTGERRQRIQALVVPDEQTWTVHGLDPAMLGIEPAFEPRAWRRLFAPDRLPEQLRSALSSYRELLPAGASEEYHSLPAAFSATAPVSHGCPDGDARGDDEHGPSGHGHGAHGHGELGHSRPEHGQSEHEQPRGHAEHGHGDHHDMMAIVGDPSEDGLVMEPIRLTYGPLGTTLPGGLEVEVTLDGDVVSACAVSAPLRDDEAPDALSPVAWRIAMAGAAERAEGVSAGVSIGWLRVAAVEIERAVSHLAWLRSLGRLLDSPRLVAASERALTVLQVARHVRATDAPDDGWLRAAIGQPDLAAAGRHVEELVTFVARSQALRWRMRGRGIVPAARADERRLGGPVARASGLPGDARTGDPFYGRLGFRAVVHARGDAMERTLVRAEEARAAITIAGAAVVAAGLGTSVEEGGIGSREEAVVEGPRGPVHARRSAAGWQSRAPAGEALRRVAGDAMVGLEWSAALVALTSFDVSPWSVGA